MSSNGIIASVANGHAFIEHATEFSNPSLGPVMPVSKPADIAEIIQNVLNDPATKAVSNQDASIVHISSKKYNVFITLSDSADPDKFGAGTIYQPKNTENKVQNKINEFVSKNQPYIKSQNIQEVNAMVDKFANSDLRPSTRAHMADPETQQIARDLDLRMRQNGLIVPDRSVLDQRLQADIEARRAEGRLAQEAGEMRKSLENAATNPSSLIEINPNKKQAFIISENGDFHTLNINEDGTSKLTTQTPDGTTSESSFSAKNTKGILKSIPDLKGIADVIITPTAVGLTAIFAGASVAEASDMAMESVAGNIMTAAEQPDAGFTDMAVATAKDAAALIIPETVNAVSRGDDALGIVGAVAEDTLEGGACFIGGAGGAALGGLVTSPTILGTPIGVSGGAVAGCAAGASAMDQAIEYSKYVINICMDKTLAYFGGEQEMMPPPVDHIRHILPANASAGMQPEIQSMVEVRSSTEHLQAVMDELKTQGSQEFLFPQLEERRLEMFAEEEHRIMAMYNPVPQPEPAQSVVFRPSVP